MIVNLKTVGVRLQSEGDDLPVEGEKAHLNAKSSTGIDSDEAARNIRCTEKGFNPEAASHLHSIFQQRVAVCPARSMSICNTNALNPWEPKVVIGQIGEDSPYSFSGDINIYLCLGRGRLRAVADRAVKLEALILGRLLDEV